MLAMRQIRMAHLGVFGLIWSMQSPPQRQRGNNAQAYQAGRAFAAAGLVKFAVSFTGASAAATAGWRVAAVVASPSNTVLYTVPRQAPGTRGRSASPTPSPD